MPEYRLLIVDHAVEMGGAEILLIGFLDHVDKGLFHVTLACPKAGPLTQAAGRRDIQVWLGYPTANLLNITRTSLGSGRWTPLFYPLDLLKSSVRLARLIRRESYDIVLTNSAKAHVYGTLAGFLARRPVVWRLHDIVERGTFSRLNVALLRYASRFATSVMAISAAVEEAIVSAGVKRDKVLVIHNGVSPNRTSTSNQVGSIRTDLGFDDNMMVIGFVGRLVSWKGPDCFIKAAAIVAREMPEARFVLVGDAIYGEPEYAEGLKRLSSSLGLEGKLIFTGFVDDIDEVMSGMDLVVHTSILPEPFGLVLVEAMMKGIPVVAADGGGVREIVEDGVTGMVVPAGQETAIARAILQMMSNPERARAMGKAGRKRALELFDIDVMTRNIETQLIEVLEKKNKARHDGCSA